MYGKLVRILLEATNEADRLNEMLNEKGHKLMTVYSWRNFGSSGFEESKASPLIIKINPADCSDVSYT